MISRMVHRLIDTYTIRYRGIIAKEIAQTMRRVADRYSTDADGVIDIEIAQHRLRMEGLLDGLWRTVFTEFFNIGRNRARKVKGLSPKENKSIVEEYISVWLRKYAYDKIVGITETTKRHLREIIQECIVEEGLGTLEIGKRIQSSISALSLLRGHVIARTESHGSANYADITGARDIDDTLRKEWVSAADERTRTTPPDEYDHLTVDGQTVQINSPFVVSGEELDYPGDPAGSAGNIIMCRCVISYTR